MRASGEVRARWHQRRPAVSHPAEQDAEVAQYGSLALTVHRDRREDRADVHLDPPDDPAEA
jgi:hypothetical protein